MSTFKEIKENIKWFCRVFSEMFKYNGVDTNLHLTEYDTNNRIMTFNIRRDVLGDGANNWQYRKESIIKMIEKYSPDIICMQEVMPHQAKYLAHKLGSEYYNAGLECGLGTNLVTSKLVFGEGLLIFYRKTKFSFVEKTKIKLYDGRPLNFRRAFIVTLFDNRNNREITVINTHLCHMSAEARKKSFTKILSVWNEMQNADDVCICGDFNCQLNETASGIDTFSQNFFYNKPTDKGTINHYSDNGNGKTIDFIFTNKPHIHSEVIRDKFDNKFLSDHWPVLSIIEC